MRVRSGLVWLAALVILLVTFAVKQCGPGRGEIAEAKDLAKVLRSLAPYTQELNDEEHHIANELKITLEEQERATKAAAGSTAEVAAGIKQIRDRFSGYIDRLVATRNKRNDIRMKIEQGSWSSPLVAVVQRDAMSQLQDQISRNDAWIELARNVRLRAELGNPGPYPELDALSKQLSAYLAVPSEFSLARQVRDLAQEYSFSEGEIAAQ